MAEPVVLLAIGLDAAIGWPGALYRRIGHPVGLFARLIDACERRWNRPTRPFAARRTLGAATLMLLVLLAGIPAWLAEHVLLAQPHGWIAVALLAWPALAQRSLFAHVGAVAAALERGDLPAARAAVGAIVGRDTAALDDSGVARAAIESLAESFCDGIAAPLFWLLLFGLPGVWIYKAVNTADSLIGHREERWRAFGWAAARCDDLLNLAPARLAGTLLCLAGRGGWRMMLRDAGRHASPNAGWPEAAMAGALGLRLGGPVRYDGVLYEKPWIGDGQALASSADIRHAMRITAGACIMLASIAGAAQWLR